MVLIRSPSAPFYFYLLLCVSTLQCVQRIIKVVLEVSAEQA